MFKRLCSVLVGVLLFPVSTMALADVIHWELSSHDVGPSMDEGFTLSGGFDFNTITKEIFNITVETTASVFCFTCNDYAGGMGAYGEDAEGRQGIRFTEVFKTGDVVDRDFSLLIGEITVDFNPPVFDWNVPGSFSNLSLQSEGFLRLDDPFDPEVFESTNCTSCATAMGTLVPVPEPETYSLMLVGLAAMGWKINAHRSRARRLSYC